MNPVFSLRNFRSFGEDGADFELAPITVLTGCNSAGKSSLVKAILLQEQVSKAISRKDSTNEVGLHISDKELTLGTFKKLLNKKASNGVITISYLMHSYLLAEDVRVTLEYIEDTKNVVGNGVLSKILVEKVDGTFIYSEDNLQVPFNPYGENNGELRNYLSVLENFRRFAIFARYENARSTKQSYNDNVDFYIESSSKEKEQKLQQKIDDCKVACDNIGISKKEEVGYLYTKLFGRIFCDFDLVSKWLESGTLYYYFPIFEKIRGKEKKYLRQYLMDEVNNGDWGNMMEKVQKWVNYFADDFESSSYSSFLDYFLSLEYDAMSKDFKDKNKNKDAWEIRTIFEKYNFETGETTKIPQEVDEQYQLSREKYEEGWAFMGVVDMLDMICNLHGNYDVIKYPDSSKWSVKESLKKYLNAVLWESLSPRFLKEIKYINSSSVQIKRIYSVEDTDKFGTSLKQFLDGNCQKFDYQISTVEINEAKKKYEHGYFLKKWIRAFGIGDDIIVDGTDEGLGVLIYLVKDGEKRLLADEGYGISQLVALLIQIEVLIANATIIQISGSNSMVYNPMYELSSIFVEEPEVHLHPKYQSLLAEMFVEAYQKYNIHFIIETHSEYLIRKLQVMVADKENALTSNDVSLNYVEKNENGVSYNRQIRIKEDGRLDGSFGAGFYDEAGGLSRRLFMLNS